MSIANKKLSNKNGELLRGLMLEAGFSQANFSRAIKVSGASLSLLINYGDWPLRSAQKVHEAIFNELKNAGIKEGKILKALKALPIPEPKKRLRLGTKDKAEDKAEDKEKLEGLKMVSKERLSEQARRKFGLKTDVFNSDIRSSEDVFLSNELRYIREGFLSTAVNGGFMALYGESGSGKSTLKNEAMEYLKKTDTKVKIIEPYILGTSSNGAGSLSAANICEAVLNNLRVQFNSRGSLENRFRSMHQALINSSGMGYRHLIIIEEAHSLPVETLRHLKRFYELKSGFTPLLGIILIGQQELKNVLADDNPDVREIVQRLEFYRVKPMDDLAGYVDHRCQRGGAEKGKIFEDKALDALKNKLGPNGDFPSRLYPLQINNALTRAMNLTAEIALDKVTADAVYGS